ncbi:hypothetical protein [uncultured Sphingomonas sp.]|uniref:hypothetical protein n=1 Tax=uncultured Sphingomonas sp. TaxID=158754 RepID=UPI0025D5C933|nr:hypothetical protein [uncultured Sphingomonas sp.]
MYIQFLSLQRRLHAVIDRAERALNAAGEPDIATMGQTRWEIARLLREYQLMKHNRIFVQFEHGFDDRARKARRMKADCIRSGEEYRAYIMEWSVVSILDNWTTYKAAATQAITRLRTQLQREHDGVAYLLDKAIAA